jgi:hypothetical protein
LVGSLYDVCSVCVVMVATLRGVNRSIAYDKTLVDDLVRFGCDSACFSRPEFKKEATLAAKEHELFIIQGYSK